ncbi:MAG: alpha/beta hydrolase [Actinomycetaceae bacterium]|nr:alpha/beta hydrolase [Actinomycetaceae bacterium]
MVTVSARRTGKASQLPFVLIPPMPCDSGIFECMLAYMPDVDVIVVDPPTLEEGAEGSDGNEASIEAYVYALRDALRAMDVDRVCIGGVSIGGVVAAKWAELFPQSTHGLAIMGANMREVNAAEKKQRCDLIERARRDGVYEVVRHWSSSLTSSHIGEDARIFLDESFSRASTDSFVWLQEAYSKRKNVHTFCREYTGSILLVRGVDDPHCERSDFEQVRLKAGVHRTRIVQIAQAGHFALVEKPEPCGMLLQHYWKQLISTNEVE